MPLLIKNGLLMTMTDQGCISGDLLIEHGQIARIAPCIDGCECDTAHILDAKGLVLTPGLMDLDVRDHALDPRYIDETALEAGVTTHLIHHEGENPCSTLADADGRRESMIRCVVPDERTDEELLSALNSGEKRVLCPVRSRRQCERVLRCIKQGAPAPILTELTGCQELAQEIARSRCAVIIGVHRSGGSSPWGLAARLDALGVPVAVSSCYPEAQMKLLPVCAGLCMRDGMPRVRALHTITSTPAALLGLADRGRIAPGLRADLTIFDGDPLLLATSHIMTIAGGRIYRRR